MEYKIQKQHIERIDMIYRKNMWVEFTQLSNITLITDILNDIYATYINKLDLDTNITSFQAISKKCCTFAQDFKK